MEWSLLSTEPPLEIILYYITYLTLFNYVTIIFRQKNNV